MPVIRFTARLLLAFLQLAVTLVLATGFIALMVPGILVGHLLEQPAPKSARSDVLTLSPTLTPESVL